MKKWIIIDGLKLGYYAVKVIATRTCGALFLASVGLTILQTVYHIKKYNKQKFLEGQA